MKVTDVQSEVISDLSTETGIRSALIVLRSKLRMLALTALTAGTIAGFVLIFVPNYYTATSTIIIPNQNHSFANALIGQLGPIAALTGDLGGKDSTDRYLSLLKSNTVSDALIGAYNLGNVYKESRIQPLRDKLADRTRFQVLKGGLVSISVTDRSAIRAADLANGYVDQLYKLNSRLVVDEATQRREFYQQQVEAAKQQLSLDEERLKDAQEKTGIIQPDAQARGLIDAIGQLRTEIAIKETEIKAMEVSATNSNPDLLRLKAQLAGLREELKKIEDADKPGGLVGTRNLPAAGLEYARRLRDVKVDETIVTALIKEFEEAHIDESRSAPLVQMVDRAQKPDQKAGPHRIAIVLAAMISGLIFAIVYVLFGDRKQFSSVASSFLARVDAL